MGGIGLVTLISAPIHTAFNDTTVSLAFLLVVLFAATLWGKGPALAASVAGMLSLNFFFLSPVHAITITDPENWVALGAFLITAFTAGHLSLRVKRRAAEAETERSEARRAGAYHRSLIEASLDPLVTIGPDGKIADVNAATENATGRSRGDLVGTDFSSYFSEPDRARAGYERAFRDGSVRDYALELRHRDGNTISVLYNASVYRDETGTPLGVFAAARDITERRRAETEIRSLARLQAVVAELGRSALRHGGCAPVRDDAVALVAGTLDVEFCQVVELLPGGATLLLQSGVGWDPDLLGRSVISAGMDSQSGYTLRSGGPVVVEDLATEKRFRVAPWLRDQGAVSGVTVVISTNTGPYGVLGAHTKKRRTFTPDEVHFLQAVANILGTTVERQRASEELLRIHRAQRALSSSNEALVRASDESTLLQDVCRIIVEQAGYLFCWVGRAENNPTKTVRPLAQAGFEGGYLKSANITWEDTERGRGPTGTCVRTGQLQIVKNLATDPRLGPWRTDALERGYASSVAIPLVVDSRIFGALTIYSPEVEAFHEAEVKLLRELADDLGFGITSLHVAAERRRAEAEVRRLNVELEQRVAVRTAELQAANAALQQARDREFEIGFRIQQTLLLDEPPSDMPGLRIAARTTPSQRIDGDFYIFMRHAEDCLDVVIGDVMGKGIPAALVGAAAKSHFLKAAGDLAAWMKQGATPEPQDIVRLAHAHLVRQLIELESFVTVCYARLNVPQARLDVVDCGHTGILRFCNQTGACEILHGNNLPLGVREGEYYEQTSLRFEPGDLLFFFSDGITEARNPAGELFGADRLTRCITSHRQLEPAALVEAVRLAVRAFSESDRLADDLTAIAIQVTAPAPPAARAEIEIDSDLKHLHEAREFVRTFCRNLPGARLDEEGQISLELAVDEAASNIMKHAYHGRRDQPIRLEAEASDDRISIRLHYLGEGFDPSKIPSPPLDGSRESGFGAYIISQTVDEVRYQRDERGRNCIVLAKRRNRPAREEEE